MQVKFFDLKNLVCFDYKKAVLLKNLDLEKNEVKKIVKNLLDRLTEEFKFKMPAIAERSKIDYERIKNLKFGRTSGNQSDYFLLISAFPELTENQPNEAVEGDIEKMKREIEQLKSENLEIFKTLLKLQQKLLDEK